MSSLLIGKKSRRAENKRIISAASAQTNPPKTPTREGWLPDGLPLQQPLDRNGQFPQKTLDDRTALGKFVFNFNF